MRRSVPKTARSSRRLLLLLFALVLASCIGVLSAVALYSHWYVLEVRDIPVRFETVEPMHGGFALDRTLLTFGKVPQGGGATRKITVTTPVPATAQVMVSRELAPVLAAIPASAALDAGVPLNITFELNTPTGYPLGNHTGMIRIVTTRRFWG